MATENLTFQEATETVQPGIMEAEVELVGFACIIERTTSLVVFLVLEAPVQSNPVVQGQCF